MKNTENSIDKAIPRDSDDADFYYNRGTDKMNLGQYKESIADFDTAIQINPNNPNFYYSRGAAKEKLGQSEDSLSDFIYPTGDLRQYAEAIAEYDEVIRIEPNNPDAYHKRGAAPTKSQRGAWTMRGSHC